MVNVRVGAENGTRTRDPDLGKVVLYQLSYFRRNADAKIVLFIVTSKGFTYFKTPRICIHSPYRAVSVLHPDYHS